MTEIDGRPEPDSESNLAHLMASYQAGNATAAARLAEQLSPRLLRYFTAQVRNVQEAEDLLQDCWLRVHKARHTYRPGEPLLPWIYAIARRTRIDRYRKVKRISNHEVAGDNTYDTTADPASIAGRETGILELLKTLPAQQREALMLLKVVGLSLEEVARATGTSVGAVKQRAHRAYATLRRLFGVEQ